MSMKSVVEAVYRYTCDHCEVEVDVPSGEIEPIADWVNVIVCPVRARPGEEYASSTAKNLCGPCSDACGLRYGSKIRSALASSVPGAQNRAP